MGKPFYFNLPPDIGFTLFTPIKVRIDSFTVYIYKAETCTCKTKGSSCHRQSSVQVLSVIPAAQSLKFSV
jgi:hypothetical protein